MNSFCPILRIAILGFVAVTAGCTGTGIVAYRPPHVTDPPHLDPARRMFQQTTPSARPVPLPLESPPSSSPSPEYPELIVPDLEPPPLEYPESVPTGPRFPLGSNEPAARLEMKVASPERAQVGSGATYHLSILNPREKPLYDVLLVAEFDDALILPGHREKAAEQSLGTIASGERKEIPLTLSASRPGRHCARFSILSGGREVIWKSVCVEFVPRRLEIEMFGPNERAVNGRAEFTVVLRNTTNEALHDVAVKLTAAPTLQVMEASVSAIREPDALRWELGVLKPHERVEIQAEYECENEAEDACVAVKVFGKDVPEVRLEHCLRITPVRGILALRVHDTVDPISIGDETEFVAMVRNRGLQPAREILMAVELPPGFELLGTEVRAGDQPLVVRQQRTGRRIEFDPLPSLGSERSIEYRLRVRSKAAGKAEFRASLRHATSRDAITVAEPLIVRPD